MIAAAQQTRGRMRDVPEWLVCHSALYEVVDEVVACPLAAGRPAPIEECLSCRHLAVLSNDRTRDSCSTDDPVI